jgi:stalled ribosome alternative rescue factor ArfA
MFFSIWVLGIKSNPQNSYRRKHTKQSSEPIETKIYKTIQFWGLFCVFLSLWVLRIVLNVFVSMGSGDYFVCFCLYEFWGLFCVFLSIWVLRIVLCVFVSMGNTQNNPQNSYRRKHTKQSSEPIEKKTYKTILTTHRDKNIQNNLEFWGLFCVFLFLWVLRVVLYVFVYMRSEDCFVCFFLYGLKQSSELI